MMLERTLRGSDPSSADHDDEIRAHARATVRKILDDAEGRLWDLKEAGWREPDDDDATAYAARLLLVMDLGRGRDLLHALALAQEITFLADEDRT
ncbi:MAG: hypothetical protein ACRDQU_20780 [Pseudonocardiaceae bacterium]